jgi:hypothetical protein
MTAARSADCADGDVAPPKLTTGAAVDSLVEADAAADVAGPVFPLCQSKSGTARIAMLTSNVTAAINRIWFAERGRLDMRLLDVPLHGVWSGGWEPKSGFIVVPSDRTGDAAHVRRLSANRARIAIDENSLHMSLTLWLVSNEIPASLQDANPARYWLDARSLQKALDVGGAPA